MTSAPASRSTPLALPHDEDHQPGPGEVAVGLADLFAKGRVDHGRQDTSLTGRIRLHTLDCVPHARRHRRDRRGEAMAMAFDGLHIWFLTGSQDLYGEVTLRAVREQSAAIVAGLGAGAGHPGRDRPQAHRHDAGRHPPRLPGCQRRRRLHRRHRLDAHLLAGQDVDRRPAGAAEAVPAPAHAVRSRPALRRHRHGLHEPQPVGARRPRVRLHRVAAAPSAARSSPVTGRTRPSRAASAPGRARPPARTRRAA